MWSLFDLVRASRCLLDSYLCEFLWRERFGKHSPVLAAELTFTETTLIVYALSLVGMTGFALLLDCGHIVVLYIMAGLLGFFMTGYLPVGFEFAAELTFPEPQGTSVGLLNGICQIFGILFTMGYSWLIDSQGTVWGSLYLDSTLALGVVLTFLIPKDYRRREASNEKPLA